MSGVKADEITCANERIRLARLLRQAAGATARDWVMAEPEGRAVIHMCGLLRLVEAAGETLARWRAMTREAAAAVLLAGARKLAIATDWQGWAWLS
jgi:hypothetical protein